MHIQEITSKNEVGFKVTIDSGIFGKFELTGAVREEEEYFEGDCYPVRNSEGASTPVFRNGAYFLPWQVTAAMTSNGQLDWAWIKDKDEAQVIAELLKIRALYVDSGDWYNAIRYANQLTNEYVY